MALSLLFLKGLCSLRTGISDQQKDPGIRINSVGFSVRLQRMKEHAMAIVWVKYWEQAEAVLLRPCPMAVVHHFCTRSGKRSDCKSLDRNECTL